jgi:4-oxalocrotonate tautomerase
MPHVIVKMHSGRSEQSKAKLAEEVTKAVTSTLNLGQESVSVALEDVAPSDWTEKVYKPDIVGKSETIYKKPGYNPL